jgi:hypothetical protein
VQLLCFGLLCALFLSSSVLLAQSAKPSAKPRPSQCGPLEGQLLHCPRFGFSYKVIFGWVDRTSEMQEEPTQQEPVSTPESESSPAQASPQPSSENSQTLLAIFERPPGAPGDTVSSAVVIAAEPVSNYPGVKTAADYFGAISELAEQRGFKAESDPYTFSIGQRRLVRGDFSKPRGKLTMYQTSLDMIEKGYVVSFTFIGGSEDEVEELIGNLSFAPVRSPGQTPKEKK